MASRRARRYAFVPRLLVRTAIAGVIPACALAAADGCGGSTTTVKDAGNDVLYGVAAVAYPAYEAGADVFGVAAVAYPAYEAGVPEGGSDTGSGDTGVTDGNGIDVFGVAAVAYPAYEAGPG
ncbi:MAG: hypothetical protein ACRELB_23035 [Polyangiaceae bacterium]